jgi:hypothetical protein
MPQSVNSAKSVGPGICCVTFPTVELVDAKHCDEVATWLIDASREGSIVLLADVPASLRGVNPNMVPYWLNVFLNRGLHVHAIGVVTSSLAVRVALNGLQIAMRLKSSPVEAMTAPTMEELLAWARALPPKNAAKAAQG